MVELILSFMGAMTGALIAELLLYRRRSKKLEIPKEIYSHKELEEIPDPEITRRKPSNAEMNTIKADYERMKDGKKRFS